MVFSVRIGRRSIGWVGLLAGVLGANACGGVHNRDDDDDGQGDDDGSADDDGADGAPDGGFSLILAADRVLVRQGESVSLGVTIERGAGFDEPVDVTMEDLPDGVTAGSLTIGAGESAGSLTLSAAADSAQGATPTGVAGAAGETSDSAPLRVLVGGPPGTLDQSFADGGTFRIQIGGMTTVGRGLMVQPDPSGDRILVTGAAGTQTVTIRLDESGSLDDTFGSGGAVSTGLGPSSGGLVVTSAESGRILVAGWGGDDAPMGYNSALFAYTAEGVLDPDFGNGGTVDHDLGDGYDEIHQLLQDDDGRLVTISTVFAPISAHLARFSPDGEPDAAFTAAVDGASAETAMLQPDGTVLAAGTFESDFWLARYRDDGSPDPAFDGDGQVTTSLGDTDTISGLLPASGGKLVAVGVSALDPDGLVIALARYNSNGSLDLTFGDGGRRRTAVPFDTNAPNAAILDSDDRILFAGKRPNAPTATFAVARLVPDGTVDDSFGDAGVAVVDFALGTVTIDGAFGIAIDSDGRVVVSGGIGPAGGQLLAVARLWP
jgi:uncharacterized delta-60 repeat protein